jgi:hypothetical protein
MSMWTSPLRKRIGSTKVNAKRFILALLVLVAYCNLPSKSVKEVSPINSQGERR